MINPSAEVRLQIHKYFGLPVEPKLPNDGREIVGGVTGREVLEGVKFDVYRVGNVDLTTNAGWQAATALSGHKVTDQEMAAGKITVGGVDYPLTKETSSPITTDASGTAVFSKPNGVGLYLVAENLGFTSASYPVTVRPSGVSLSSYKLDGSAPFFVALPLTNPAGTTAQSSWLYDVHVYPKNQGDTITKTVSDKGMVSGKGFVTSQRGMAPPGIDPNKFFVDGFVLGADAYLNNPAAVPKGNRLTYTLTASIPMADSGPQLGKYYIADRFYPFLTYVSSSVKILNATAAGGEKVLVAGTDYVLTPDPVPAPAKNSEGYYPPRVLNWSMTPAGLVELVAAKKLNLMAQVQITLVADLDYRVVEDSLTAKNQINLFKSAGVENYALLVPSQAWWDRQDKPNELSGIQSNYVSTYFFDVQVKKVDPQVSAAEQPDFAGVEFKIYWDPTPGDGQCSAGDVSGIPIATAAVVNKAPDGSPIPKTGDPRYNKAFFYSLQLPSFYDGVDYGEGANPDKSKWLSYCVVESKAPAGYMLSATPQYVSEYKKDRRLPYGDTYAQYLYADLEFRNVKANLGNQLPLTGGEGAAALGLAGVLLIGGGIGYYTISRRRRS